MFCVQGAESSSSSTDLRRRRSNSGEFLLIETNQSARTWHKPRPPSQVRPTAQRERKRSGSRRTKSQTTAGSGGARTASRWPSTAACPGAWLEGWEVGGTTAAASRPTPTASGPGGRRSQSRCPTRTATTSAWSLRWSRSTRTTTMRTMRRCPPTTRWDKTTNNRL